MRARTLVLSASLALLASLTVASPWTGILNTPRRLSAWFTTPTWRPRNRAGKMLGVAQVAAYNRADRFTGLVQVGGHKHRPLVPRRGADWRLEPQR